MKIANLVLALCTGATVAGTCLALADEPTGTARKSGAPDKSGKAAKKSMPAAPKSSTAKTKPSLKTVTPRAVSDRGENLFKQTCAACHPGGANIVTHHKTIYDSVKLASFITFKNYLEAPNGHMPYYKFIVKDKQLLDSLYRYTKRLKKPTIS